jgi:hypothetical protein
MINASITVGTTCCKLIIVNLLKNIIFSNVNHVDAISIVLSAPPTYKVLIYAYEKSVYSTSADSKCTFSPSLSFFNYSVISNPYMISMKCGNNLQSGFHIVSIKVVEYSKQEYNVEYQSSNQFLVVNTVNYIAPPPFIINAMFDSYGSTIDIVFNRPTNKAKLPDVFPCHILFRFSGSNSTVCSWADTSTVQIRQFNKVLLNIGDIVKLSLTSSHGSAVVQLKAYCPVDLLNCNSWPSIDPKGIVSINGPLNPIKPNIIVTGPSQISYCQNLTLDFSSSSGSLGRKWMKITVQIETSKSVSVVVLQNLKKLVLDLLSTSSRNQILIPANFLEVNTIYFFYFEFCNYFYNCGVGSYNVFILDYLVPTVAIYNHPSLNVKVSDNITLYSSVSSSSCDSRNFFNNLTLTWSVYQNGVLQTRFVSNSNDKLKFSLDQFKLSSGKEYKIQLTVFDNFVLSSATSIVYVCNCPIIRTGSNN